MKIYAAYYRRRYHRSPFKKFLPVGLLVLLLILIGFSVTSLTRKEIISPLAQAQDVKPTKKATQPSPTTSKKNPEELKRVIEQQLDSTLPEYSIIVDDFLHPLTVSVGDQVDFIGASIHKIFILLTILKEIELNHLSWDATVIFDEVDRQDYGTGSMRYKRAGGKYTIRELATLMMKESDNTAAYILAQKIVSFSMIQKNLISWGLNNTSMEENTTNNADLNLIFKRLLKGELLTNQLKMEALELMKDSLYEDRIPGKLPKSAVVYHKIGTAIASINDVGVVATPKSTYYIGIFTKGVSDEPGGTEAIARISRAVYDYMQSN